MGRMTAAGVALALGLAGGPAGCAPATVGAEALGITARDAFLEGRTRSLTWDPGARLRWVEGVSIAPAGVALPGAGFWRLHYTAPGRAAGLVVTVGSLEISEEERAPATPPGIDIGNRAVQDTFVDSPEALGRVLAARAGSVPERATALLVPADPLQWVVTFPEEARRWRVDATTGEALTP